MATAASITYRVSSGQSVNGGRWPGGRMIGEFQLTAMALTGAFATEEVSWTRPDPGSTAFIGYSTGTHPISGIGASVVDLDPTGKSWNPTPANSGPWNGGVTYQNSFGSINGYSGGAWSATERKFFMFGGGHSAYNFPAPYSYSSSLQGWQWEAIPVPSDALAKCSKVSLTRAIVEAQYPTTQYNYTWGEWQGDWSGWPTGFGRAGEIFPEATHSYFGLVWVPGTAIGNTNGAMLITIQSTGMSPESVESGGGGHYFDLDTRRWIRNSNLRIGNAAQSGGFCGGACWFGGSINRVFALSHKSSTYPQNYIDVWNPTTKTWFQTTSTNSVSLSLVGGGLLAHEPSGLLIQPCAENSSNVPTYRGTQFRFTATSASQAVSGGHTWALLNITASSWPLNTVGSDSGSVAGVGWCYCPDNGCYYALPFSTNGTTLWKLSPPVGATTIAEYLAGIWTVTTETLSTGVRMRNLDDTVANSGFEAHVYNRLVWDDVANCLLYFDASARARVQAITPQGL